MRGRTESHGPFLPGVASPWGCEWDGPLVAKAVLAATAPAGCFEARWACPASPGPAWASAEYCSDVLGQPRPSSVLQVGLAQRAAGRPCRHKRQSGCGGHGYLVFWRSSRSQVGSVWPILYSSLESSMLWSR